MPPRLNLQTDGYRCSGRDQNLTSEALMASNRHVILASHIFVEQLAHRSQQVGHFPAPRNRVSGKPAVLPCISVSLGRPR